MFGSSEIRDLDLYLLLVRVLIYRIFLIGTRSEPNFKFRYVFDVSGRCILYFMGLGTATLLRTALLAVLLFYQLDCPGQLGRRSMLLLRSEIYRQAHDLFMCVLFRHQNTAGCKCYHNSIMVQPKNKQLLLLILIPGTWYEYVASLPTAMPQLDYARTQTDPSY